MRKTWKRIVSVVMALAMVVLCLPGYSNPVKTAKAAAAGSVEYISGYDDNGNPITATLSSGQYVSITSNSIPSSLNSTWYVVQKSTSSWTNYINVTNRLSFAQGVNAVNIVLLDGSDLYVRQGIHVPAGKTLNIYAQSTGNNAGKHIVTGRFL